MSGEILYVDDVIVDEEGNACCIAHTSDRIIIAADYASGAERVMVIDTTPTPEERSDG